MKSFSIQRFARIVRRDILGNYRQNLRLLAGFYLCNLILEVVVYLKPSRTGLQGLYDTPDALRWAIAALAPQLIALVTGVMFLLFLFSAASAFSNLSTKQKRIAELTLPATNAERYFSRLLQAIVLWPLGFILAFVLADLTRMLVFPAFGYGFPSAVPVFFDKFGSFFSGSWEMLSGNTREALLNLDGGPAPRWTFFMLWGFIVGLHSFYLLGGAVFRRRPVIYTSLVFVAVCVLLGVSVTRENLNTLRVSADMEELSAKVFIVLQWAFAIACYALSYYIYKRITVIPRKLLRK